MRIDRPRLLPRALGVAALACLTSLSTLAFAQAAPDAAASTSTAACPALLNKTFPRLQDEKPQSLCQYSGKVLLVVNTASFCGFTSQYKDLEALYSRYKDQGLVVLGFPSNDFHQETGTAKEIADLCANTFGVKFPMFAKTHVRGEQANPLYAELTRLSGTSPKWNFYKYLVARDGRTVQSRSSLTSPQDPAFVRDIEKLLAAR